MKSTQQLLNVRNQWRRIGGRSAARVNEPVPYTREHEEFCPNIMEELVEQFKDANGDIRHKKVFEWLLPCFGKGDEVKIGYFEFIADGIRNYMLHIIKTKDFKPKYYNPATGLVVTGQHVAWFMGCHQAIQGFPQFLRLGWHESLLIQSEQWRTACRRMRTVASIVPCILEMIGKMTRKMVPSGDVIHADKKY